MRSSPFNKPLVFDVSSDILTEFRGRSDEIRVHPLSFAEYYSAVGGDKGDAFDAYAFFGGMERKRIQREDVLSSILELLCAAIGFRQQEMTHIMENIIYNELVIRECVLNIGIIDFLLDDTVF